MIYSNDFLMKIIACPKCKSGFIDIGKQLILCSCGSEYRVIDKTPIFLNENSDYSDQRKNKNITNPYSPKSLNLIHSNPNSLILDFGSGNPRKEELFTNVFRLDFVHYSSVHVVSNFKNLPFKDETFDHIISESVFEHVSDPWCYAKELHRVLKKNGKIIIDTAFIQPLHSDPFHYYNMTLSGLKQTFRMFYELDSGVEPYQSSSTAMNILRDQYLDLIEDTQKRNELFSLIGEINYAAFDKYIPDDKQHYLSAGVYFVGTKKH